MGRVGRGKGRPASGDRREEGQGGRQTHTLTRAGRGRQRETEGWEVGRALKREHGECAQMVLFMARAEDVYSKVRLVQVELVGTLF